MRIIITSLPFLLISLLSCTINAQAPEYGIASVYADKLAGRSTASGEPYDLRKFTAAHKTLPFGTFIKVTRIDNDKSVVVKVNDRGPHVKGRVVDISRIAAQQLDLNGLANVRVDIVDDMTDADKSVSANTSKTTSPSPTIQQSEGRFEWFPKEIKPASANASAADTAPAEPARAEKLTAKGEDKDAGVASLRSLLITSKTEAPQSEPARTVVLGDVEEIPVEYNAVVKAPTTGKAKTKQLTTKGAEKPKTFDILNLVPLSKTADTGNPAEAKTTASVPATRYSVQVASFTSAENAKTHAEKLRAQGFSNAVIQESQNKAGDTLYKVTLGDFDGAEAADNYKSALKSKYNLDGFVIRLKS